MEPIGYSFLIHHFGLKVLPPYKTSYVTEHSTRIKEITSQREVEYLPAKHKTDGSWQSNLLFAIKHEDLNLHALQLLFQKVSVHELTEYIRNKPNSVYLRRIWFFYEFLTGKELPLPPLNKGNFDYVLPKEEYLTVDDAHAVRNKRQRLINNLAGDAEFCPIVRMTDKIKQEIQKDYTKKISDVLAHYPMELVYRACSFLYLKETKNSFAIERQTPTQKRTAAFMQILQNAGRNEITKSLLIQLQNTIVDDRYQEKDYRREQVYVGQTIMPGKEFIHFAGAKPDDIPGLMDAWLHSFQLLVKSDCHPVIAAAVLSFAFVFIHPFGDGNGRIHRYLLHHVLAAKKFHPNYIIYPISAVLYKNAGLYDSMLESFSKLLMPYIDYVLIDEGAMTIINETGAFYRFINFTKITEYLFDAVAQTLETELIPELDYLIAWDKAKEKMRNIVDMPEKKMMQFIMFTQQNHGIFPKGRLELFQELSNEEIEQLSEIVRTTINQRTEKE